MASASSIVANFSLLWINSGVSSKSLIIPIWWAILAAVKLWSPVTIITLIPAILHLATASLTPSLGGSSIATNPTKVRPVKGKFVFGSVPFFLGCSLSSFSISKGKSGGNWFGSNLLYANPITLSPFNAKAWFASLNLPSKFLLIGISLPFIK